VRIVNISCVLFRAIMSKLGGASPVCIVAPALAAFVGEPYDCCLPNETSAATFGLVKVHWSMNASASILASLDSIPIGTSLGGGKRTPPPAS
jgi:hypothetical protein